MLNKLDETVKSKEMCTVCNFDVHFQIRIFKGHLCMCPLDTSLLIWQTKTFISRIANRHH